jgi:hypothetical protein
MKEYKTTAMKSVSIRKDGKVIRLEIGTTEGDVGFLMPSTALASLIPGLVKAEAQAKQSAGITGFANLFNVDEVGVAIPDDKNGLIITLKFPHGLEGGMSFRVDIETGRRLSGMLAALVAQSGESPKTAH